MLVNSSVSRPSAVTNLAVSEVTSSSIEISWSPPDNDGGNITSPLFFNISYNITVFTGGPVTYYLIEVAGRRIEVGPDARNYVLTGLIPETNYG